MVEIRMRRLRAIKEENERRKIVLRDMAKETGLAVGTLQRLMTGNANMIDLSTLNTLCQYFGCQVCDLLVYVPDAGMVPQHAEHIATH